MTAPMPPPQKPPRPNAPRPATAGGKRVRAAGRLLGSLDRIEPDGTLEGWCWSPATPLLHRTVAITVDGHVVARAACNRPRPDLAQAGRGEGDHGFLLRLPQGVLRPGARAEIALRDVATGQLVGKPVRMTWGDGAAAPETAVATARPPLSGNLDRVTRDGWVSGWCWDPQRPARRVGLDVLVDGTVVGTTQAGNWRADLQQAGIGDGSHGFAYALPYEVLARRGTLRISVRETGAGRMLGEPVVLRIGRPAEGEQRVASLERQVRLLRAKLDQLERQSADQPAEEDRAARALFGTVAAFFRELAEGTPEEARGFGLGGGLRATLDELAARLPLLVLRSPPAAVDVLVIVPATEPVEVVHRCLASLHAAGVDSRAALLLLDPGEADARTALLPSLVRGLRYEHCGSGGLVAACNEAMRRGSANLVAFVDPRAGVAPAWLETLQATFEHEPDAAVVGSLVLRADGLVQHGGFAIGQGAILRDPAQFAEADRSEHRFLHPVGAVAALALGARRDRLLEQDGFDPAYSDLTHAVIAACARLRASGAAVLVQPASAAFWNGLEADPGSTVPDLTGAGEDARRLRLALLDETDGMASGRPAFVGHALVVDDTVPRPDRDAGSVITLAQMRVLRRLGWRVTFAPASGVAVADTDRQALERLGVEVALPPQHPSVAQYLRDHGPELDLVQIVRFGNAAALGPAVRELAPRAKLLFAPADLHFLREAREAALLGNRRDAPLRRKRRASELACVRAADATLLLSDHEQALLAAETDPAKLHVLRWIAEPAPSGPDFGARDGLLFMGGFAHRPNVDAVRWYAEAILPVLRRLRPGLVLHVVGADPPPEIAGLAGPDIVVHGWVRDLGAVLDRVRLSLAPLRYGAGFKGKVATSLSHGVPVVATPVAVEGTGLEDGDGVAVARAPDAFARAIAHLHDDPAAWSTLSRRAVERVRALYSPEAATTIYRRLLASLDLPFR